MIFSLGNLLSITVVLVILIIYRQLDRNNRSLEKVKRFSDKIKGDLDGLVEGKTAEMKNLAIELQVNLKTGREVLKRVREVEQGLAQKSERIDQIKNRIDSYDHALSELVGMTARVEENLKRVQSESLFVDKVGKRVGSVSQKLQSLEQDMAHVHGRFREENRKELAALREEVGHAMEQKVQGLAATVMGSEQKIKDFGVYVTRLEARGEQMQEQAIAALHRSFEELELDARGKRSGLLNQFTASLGKLQADAELKVKALHQGLTGALGVAERKLQDQQKQLLEAASKGEALEGKVFERLKASMAKDSAEAAALRQQLHAAMEELKASRRSMGEALQGMEREVERFREEAQKKLAKAAEQMQVTALQNLEKSLESYAGQMEYKFQKLQSANVEIEAMEKNLRGLIEKTSGNVRQELAVFGAKLEEERKAEREKVLAQFAELQGGMKELEQGLNELKAKAYENVSEQLEVFEDDFFKDLRQRSFAMEEKLKESQAATEATVQELVAQHLDQREKQEKRFGEQLKNGLEKVRQEQLQGLEQLQGRVAEFENGLAERIGLGEQRLREFEGGLLAELERSRQQVRDEAGHHFASLQDALEQKSRQIEREVEDQLKGIGLAARQSGEELQRDVDSVKAEVTAWQARLDQQVKAQELELIEKTTSLRQQADGLIGSIRESFETQKEDLITSTNADRLKMKEEFDYIKARTDELEKKLTEKSEAALESFHSQMQAFQTELSQRTKDMQVEMDNRLREFKHRSVEMKEKAEALQASLYGKIDEGYKLLGISLSDMDKRVKGFVAQTRIFERGDELRTALEGRVDEMKREIEKLQARHKEVEELDARLAGMHKVAEEMGGKLSRLLSERGRIEGLDSDFKKLLSISRELDQRLETVTSSQDSLQEIQAKIRELENLDKLTEGRLERLEKKKTIIEATTAGVDRNFQQLDELEKALKSAQEGLAGCSGKLQELSKQSELLASNREKSEYVVEKMQDLDGILGDLEERMEKMDKAREWLAKTETRFETVGKQAQEQVRLMESILKANKKQAKLGEGAPPLDKRETVVKLAHLGWTPAEIARTTKLSRGEVELILELAPRK